MQTVRVHVQSYFEETGVVDQEQYLVRVPVLNSKSVKEALADQVFNCSVEHFFHDKDVKHEAKLDSGVLTMLIAAPGHVMHVVAVVE